MKILTIILSSFLIIFSCKTSETAVSNESETSNSVSIENGKIAKADQLNVTIGTNVGNRAPEIVQNNLDGKPLKLSSLKGQYVLIDFWASWCGPCRRENPNIVAAYNKYKEAKFKSGKGFEIFSVSLDKSKAGWKKAIEADKLDWEYHVSDLQFWQNAAAKEYKVGSIPMNFLLDPNGIIIAKNLRGSNLHKELDKHIKSL